MVFRWFYSDLLEEYPKVSKWVNGFIITIAVLCILGIIVGIYRLPKLRDEITALKAKEKQLEQEIERQ